MNKSSIEQIPWSITLSNSLNSHIVSSSSLVSCYFIEDIYSYIMTGKIVVYDNVGFDEFLPLVGGELLTISYTSQMGEEDPETKTHNFVIHKINRIDNDDNHRKTIEMLFVQPQHYDFHMNNFSLSIYDSDYSNTVKYIMNNHIGVDKFIEFEDSVEKLEYFTTNLKSPASNIKWLMDRSSSKVTKTPGYLLYYNTKGGFNFITMESLLSNSKMMDGDNDKYLFTSDNPYHINKILNSKINKVDYNTLNKLSKGLYLGYDIKRKKIIRREYSYSDALKMFSILGRYSLFDETKMDFKSIYETSTSETDKNIIDNMYYGDWIKQYCIQQTVDIVVIGHNRRYAGGIIEINWPSGDADSIISKNMQGKYLVRSIIHHYTPFTIDPYKQKMVLIKNGFNDSDYRYLTKSVKVNI